MNAYILCLSAQKLYIKEIQLATIWETWAAVLPLFFTDQDRQVQVLTFLIQSTNMST